ncbi:MAG TPA: DNA repair protein RecN [Acetobacteraceae bacterium]|nr:DNA repair protein RecN [Acetobacteraceae bacterium]
MLTALSLRDVVLIDRQDIAFGPGLSVLTGETGAGKSILLDGLGLALGTRADAGLVARHAAEASAVACFAPPSDHPVRALLAEQGIGAEDEILLRRVLSRDGRSRGFINDQPVGVGLLRRVGAALVEIQSQNAQIGLADPPVQRALLDAFGVDPQLTGAVSTAFSAWRTAARAAEQAALGRERTEQNAQWLAHVIQELEALAPEPDEEERLAIERQRLQEGERRAEALAAALAELAPRGRSGPSPAAAVRAAIRALSRLAPPLAEPVAALERAEEALDEAASLLARLTETEAGDPKRLERAETRLFALRAAARKHGVSVAELPELCARLKSEFAAIEDEAAAAEARARDAASARESYVEATGRLAAARREAARQLEAALARELPPLRLEKARFHCRLEALAERDWGPEGTEAVSFLLAANPGQEPMPLARAASGGELARLMLALKVVVMGARNPGTLVFDEVDAGIGGATAAAVGERLARIAERVQVLVVTHSPQVAVHGRQHFRITKEALRGRTTTRVTELDGSLRQEEIARMLAGATVTDAARAAAASLLAGPQPAARRRGLRAGG